ncbi:hypothetical protein BU23DRAFT_60222 [Bimuria novae-zelandiae CBS 107.79]|uniref:Uncharacterized protein n=1 Tax=Bimuria novae-zelandiae CBS 107.79 TaxID=1447943 RepID=A0A6A5VK19_9PLEO|nr:hypothetical protein BU23DRAFT_60222 [Bimuria novae-zelandiae CBS 107.79]
MIMSIPFVGSEVGVMPCGNPFLLVPCADHEHEIATDNIIPLKELAVEEDGFFTVLPSSDSICSTKTDQTSSSWRSSSTVSTLATSITSSLGKGLSKIWCGHGDAARLKKPPRRSRWNQGWPCPRPYEENVDLEAGESWPLQILDDCRSYSGCERKGSPDCDRKVATSIQLTLDFEYRSHTYELEYAVFRQWKYVSLLVNAIQEDGVKCVLIWDEHEKLQVMAGDWEARARPRWQVTVFCEDLDIDEDEFSEVGDEKDTRWDDEEGASGEWWFQRWKTRVEKRKTRMKTQRKPWLIGAVAMAGIIVAFVTVAWFSMREHRTIATDGEFSRVGGRLTSGLGRSRPVHDFGAFP